MKWNEIRQPFIEKFPGDLSGNPYQRQTPGVLYALVDPVRFKEARLLDFNEELSEEIGLGRIERKEEEDFLNAASWPSHIKPYATPYAGHQFGVWAGQLGDGRAIFAGEIINDKGEPTELQWKGAGATPYSRSADGRAVFRSTLREYLMSEALYYLGVPTTRSLSLSLSGEQVLRDKLYSGNVQAEKGAVMIRTAPSFLRFGHFELLSSQDNLELLKKLAEEAISRDKEWTPDPTKDRYLSFFERVCERTAELAVQWFRVGFTHGVLNTDNMSILGLTIDYGPFSMLDEYALLFTPNTTDLPDRRYAFGKQGQVVQWNLWQLANALHPLVEDKAGLQETLEQFSAVFWEKYDRMMAGKFGLSQLLESDGAFFDQWQSLMQKLELDYTLFFKALESYRGGEGEIAIIIDCAYRPLSEKEKEELDEFLTVYKERLEKEEGSMEEGIQIMKRNNPKFILRNYLLLECIEEMEKGENQLFEKLKKALRDPYSEPSEELGQKRPPGYEGRFGSSMLSCSS